MFGFGKKKRKLTKKQKAQRKYACAMRGVRSRAKKAGKGSGRIAKRTAATRLRRKMGLGSGSRSKRRS